VALADLKQACDAPARTGDVDHGTVGMIAGVAGLCARLPAMTDSALDLGCGAGEPVAGAFIGCGWRATGVASAPRC
jgi:hypothetical protein